MRKIFGIFAIIILLFSCGKDNNADVLKSIFIDKNTIIVDPTKYTGMNMNKDSIFVDNFNDNSNNWAIETNSDHSFAITNGNYCLSSYSTSFWLCYNSKIALPDNYEIEIDFLITNNNVSNDQKNGIIWGATSNLTDYYYLGLNNNLNYIIKSSSATPAIETPSAPVVIYPADNYNKITLRKYLNNYYFFINENLAKTTVYNAPPGNMTGIFVGEQCSIKVDYIKFYKLSVSN